MKIKPRKFANERAAAPWIEFLFNQGHRIRVVYLPKDACRVEVIYGD